MKKLLINIILIALIGNVFISCSKQFINQTPADSIDQGDALIDEASMQAALNGVYAALRSSTLYGRDFPVIGDLQADNTYIETNNSGRYLPQFQYTVTDGDGTANEMWTSAYQAIMRANRIIDADVTGSGIASVKAQAYALRALMYFKLVNIYAKPYTDDPSLLGVPIALHYDPYNLPARNTIKEVYDQIVSDFKTAFNDAPEYTSSIYLSKYAIEGLLARTYMYMNDMPNALTTAKDVINNGPFQLVMASDLRAFWNDPSRKSDAVEVMFEADADVINNNGFDDIGAIYENGYQDIYASMELYDLYSATDARKNLMIEGTTKTGNTAILVDKYPNATSDDRDNVKVIRLAEVYLIAAEASARTGDDAGARTYLNDLMKQRDPNFTGYTSSGADLINDIITERRKELAFEGDRLYDLNRLMWTIDRANYGQSSIPYPQTILYPTTDDDQTADERIAPIPLSEIQSNPNIQNQQNPGY